MNNIFRIQLIAMTIAISFYITYAFAFSNSDMPSIGGEGSNVISGWSVSNMNWVIASDPSKIQVVEFDLNDRAGMVKVSLNSKNPVFFDCENTVEFHWVCSIHASMSISEADEFRVIATGG